MLMSNTVKAAKLRRGTQSGSSAPGNSSSAAASASSTTGAR
jgi:hypothetical protein